MVTCVDAAKVQAQSFNESDFKVEWYSGTGAGGQYRNKHQNSCRITHLSTGVVSTSQCRSRENSFAEAQASILEKLNQRNAHSHAEKAKAVKSAQGGSGERGDKIRTYMFQHGIVTHHSTGGSLSVDKVMAGKFDLFW